MKKLSFLVSRSFLALLAIVILGMLVWFLGPYVAFGGLKPLAAIGMRILVIALLLVVVLFWLKEWSPAIVFGVLLCLLIWYAAPLVSFGQAVPFAPVAARVIAIAVVIGLFAVYAVYRIMQRMRSDGEFLKKALAFGTQRQPSPAAERVRDIETRFNTVLARLKSMRYGARGMGRLFQNTRYLYELPWYVTLGAPASGKTSALLNAGLAFPGGTSASRAAGSSPSTKDVDWWLTNDAVLIDTAGYYTLHGRSAYDLAPPAGQRDAIDTKDSPSRIGTVRIKSEADWRRRVDQDEWYGFLDLLRRRRPRAPINGALLAISVEVLSARDPALRAAQADALRDRLTELRTKLGVRFPVYVVVTQMDRLPGFADYFESLTEEHRAQMWGFTLPLTNAGARTDLAARCAGELRQLASRLASGVNTRLEDEYDVDRRRRLVTLPEAFSEFSHSLVDTLAQLFVDSRYDDTEHRAPLRGVYLTSALQGGPNVVAEPLTIVQRLVKQETPANEAGPIQPAGNHSYFLRDLFSAVVFREANLVRPNLRWEYRFRLVRLLGHSLVLLLSGWLALGLHTSFGNNSDYLNATARKTQALATKTAQLYRDPKPDAIPDTLSEARYLPTWTGLDLSAPESRFRYGLYSAPGVIDASRKTYRALEDNLLLPTIVHRLEDVIAQSIADRDPKATYDALRIYLMLNAGTADRTKFNAAEIRIWVLDDWARNDSAAIFGGRASMVEHVEQLFSGERVVQSPLIRNDSLIQQARTFLDSSNATQRLYDRAKADIEKGAPDEFTLLRAVGPQAGTVFTRASGAPLSRGIPGLFTFDGYRNLFDKRLTEFVSAARDDDAWVMGRSYLAGVSDGIQKKTAEIANGIAEADDPLTEAIRRLYLTEYAQRWDAFLADIRTVSGTSLAFNLQVLRQFAAPDSPLARLARAAVHETALTQVAGTGDRSLLQKAANQIAGNAGEPLGIRPEERVERELVDSRFAALREIVTGSADTSASSDPSANAQAGKTGLDGITSLLNEYYTALTVADNAIANNSMPPASDAAAKLKMAASTMPAPFRHVLLALSSQGSREVNQGIGQLLSRQMQAVVSDTCRLTVEGNYPFAPDSPRDVSIDDFTRVFAQGGLIDDFFTKNLAPFVDTSTRPWRYRTLPGATEAVQGPDLEPFQHAKHIREIFFGDQGKQLQWKTEIRVAELDPTVTKLAVDIDGQSLQYQHGPVSPFPVNWPGPRGGVHAELTASPRIRVDTSTVATDGPWALMRLLRKGQIVQTATPGRTRVAFDFDGRKAVLDLASAGSVANPLTSDVLATFRCPSSMPVFSLPDSGPPPGLPPAIASAAPSPSAAGSSGL